MVRGGGHRFVRVGAQSSCVALVVASGRAVREVCFRARDAHDPLCCPRDTPGTLQSAKPLERVEHLQPTCTER